MGGKNADTVIFCFAMLLIMYIKDVQANERGADTKNTYHGAAAWGIRMQQDENKETKF
ncbi:MAG: hypothetical protein MUO63_21675 [Desulfobulbaceae bacterium]|nr:hypothetical protein [Desulfobulbaceae bacterium]